MKYFIWYGPSNLRIGLNPPEGKSRHLCNGKSGANQQEKSQMVIGRALCRADWPGRPADGLAGQLVWGFSSSAAGEERDIGVRRMYQGE